MSTPSRSRPLTDWAATSPYLLRSLIHSFPLSLSLSSVCPLFSPLLLPSTPSHFHNGHAPRRDLCVVISERARLTRLGEIIAVGCKTGGNARAHQAKRDGVGSDTNASVSSTKDRTIRTTISQHKPRQPTKRKMKTTALAVGLAVALAVAAVSTCQAEKEETYLEAATHFCGKFGISPPPLSTIRKSC